MNMLPIIVSIIALMLLAGGLGIMVDTFEDRKARHLAEKEQLRFRRAVMRILRVKWFAVIATFDKKPKPLNIYQEYVFDNRLNPRDSHMHDDDYYNHAYRKF